MAGAGLGGYFASDPNPNPFNDMLPPTGAVLDGNGQPVVDEEPDTSHHFDYVPDEDGWDPPTGNGLLTPKYPVTYQDQSGVPVYMNLGGSKLDKLKFVEEQIRDLLIERRRLLGSLRTERDEINERLNVSEQVTEALDSMFPEKNEPEFKPESEGDTSEEQ